MRRLVLTALSLAATLAACTETEIVYEERPPFNEPADPSSGFLGYYTASSRQTTCGNCHADFQGSWKETRHASAYATLKAISSAQPSCYSCHTINERGNDATGIVGHDKVQDSTYFDVQCESCHGPGLEHVSGVNQGTLVRPLARIGVGPDTSAGCAACHNGTHHPYVEQWAASRHANVRSGSPTTNSTCIVCHEGRGKLTQLGVTSNYAEKTGTTPQAITCAVCHNPHGSPYEGDLRLSISNPDPSANLCMSCHLRRGEPSTSSSEPHGAQGAVLLGFAGWRPPDFVYDTARIYGSHATEANPNLCAGCHVQPFTVNDASGNFQFESVGHLFKPVPCLENGVPTGNDDCAFTPAARNWSSCTKSGCHANAAAASAAFNSTRVEIQLLADLLWKDTDGDRVIDAFAEGGDQGFLPKIRLNDPGAFSTEDATISAANGTEFNVRTCAEGLTSHPDGSKGVHNKFLCVALLAQSASYLQTLYNYLPAPPAATAALLRKYGGRLQEPGLRVARERFPVTSPR